VQDAQTLSSTGKLVLIILDGVGIGELPDAALYADEGSNTLVNMANVVGGLRLPNLASLGLGNIASIKGVTPSPSPRASFGRIARRAIGRSVG
jgi:phosphopentomutase